MHSAIFLAANSWMQLGGRRTLIEPTFYHHKTEAIRIINERLGDRSAATSDSTVGAIACLVLLEVSIHNQPPLEVRLQREVAITSYQALNGAADIASVHLNGLKQLVDLRGDLHSPTMCCYLQRIIMMWVPNYKFLWAELTLVQRGFVDFFCDQNPAPFS